MKKEVLIVGGSSMVGSRFTELNRDHFTFEVPTENELNLLDMQSVNRVVGNSPVSTVVNFAAFTNVGKAEEEKGNKDGLAYKLNAKAVEGLARACKDSGKRLVHISTEYVFDGMKKHGLYKESDKQSPINWYGRTKYDGEELVQGSGCAYTIARISMPYRARFPAKPDLARTFLSMLRSGQEISGCIDVINTPTLIDDLTHGLKLVIDHEIDGIIHLSSEDGISPFLFAKAITEKFGLDGNLVKPIAFNVFCEGRPAPLLKNSGLDTSKFQGLFGRGILHTVNGGLENFKQQMLY